MRRNLDAHWDSVGQYATDLYTKEAQDIIANHNTSRPLFLYLSHLAVHTGNSNDPLQAPQEIIDQFYYIRDEKRRIYAGKYSMTSKTVVSKYKRETFLLTFLR